MEESNPETTDRARHDAAIATARAILEIVAPCLRPEERHDAFEEFYYAVSAGLEAYEAMRAPSPIIAAEPSLN